MNTALETSERESISSLQAIRQVIGPFRKRIALFCAATLLVGLLEALFLVVITRAALAIADGKDVVQVTRGVEATIGQTVLIGLVVLTIRFVSSYGMIRIQTGLTYRITAGYRSRLGKGFLRSSYRTQIKQQSGALQQLVVEFPAQLSTLVYQLSNAIAGALGLLALLSIATIVDPFSTVIVLVALILLYAVLVPMRRIIERRSKRTLERRVAFANRVAEISSLNLEINTLGVTPSATERLQDAINDEAEAANRLGTLAYMVSPTYLALAYGAILLAIWAMSSVSLSSINEVGAVMLIMLRSLSYGQQLQQGSISIGQFGPYAQSISDRIEEFERDPQWGGSQFLRRIDLVRFDRVDFGYSERERVLQRVDVSIERGQIIGLVGPSGSGKTSFVHLLLGLYEPTQGSIRVNGIDLRDIDRESWHRLVAYVPQETNLITGTIRENVRFLRSEIPDSSIDATLLRAGLDLDPATYPSGAETNLGEAGRQFSGGQRQRLAIARALVTNPSLLVLDEPTSALDAESEEVILETLDKLRGEVTIVVITHRIDTLRVCDRVFRITDRSIHEESGQPGL